MNTKFLACLVFAILASVDAHGAESIKRSMSDSDLLNEGGSTCTQIKSQRDSIRSSRDSIQSTRDLMTSSSDRKNSSEKNLSKKGKEPFIQSWMLYVTGAAVVVAVTTGAVFYWRSRDNSLIKEEQV